MSQVTYQRTSPYYSTNQVNQYVPYLAFWDGYFVLPNAKDTLVSIDAQYDRRPDLMSYAWYQTPHLWWVFMLRNPDVIKDPEDLRAIGDERDQAHLPTTHWAQQREPSNATRRHRFPAPKSLP